MSSSPSDTESENRSHPVVVTSQKKDRHPVYHSDDEDKAGREIQGETEKTKGGEGTSMPPPAKRRKMYTQEELKEMDPIDKEIILLQLRKEVNEQELRVSSQAAPSQSPRISKTNPTSQQSDPSASKARLGEANKNPWLAAMSNGLLSKRIHVS